ncbi:uncharacterized protein FMAN_09405 [Fusarium mangiferae]|uniref:Uncharacterized protein n=1 Tax=Fusarium mangiferae TaxID=192010 RepID=A0A1L7T3H7_FUSMA|nr:uncharacterized protein FMAN_09405 [Fusarium mangiferae]CVK91262.1 uncharacterized protein FMAN_09405 [Fusarium mangiferae]
MDDPAYAWPAWKFGLKKEVLSNKLHDQYNTYVAPIQSPEAFYHDISEIAHTAHSAAEFHRLALGRRQQRLNELNEALDGSMPFNSFVPTPSTRSFNTLHHTSPENTAGTRCV